MTKMMTTGKSLLLAASLMITWVFPALADSQDQEGMYRNYTLREADPNLCKQSCEEDSLCTAWTYIPPIDQRDRPRCWLYNHPAPLTLFPLSGTKYETNNALDIGQIQDIFSGNRSLPESLPDIISLFTGTRQPAAPPQTQPTTVEPRITRTPQQAPTASRGERGSRTGAEPEIQEMPEAFMQQSVRSARTASIPSAHVWQYLYALGAEPEGYATYSYVLSGRNGLRDYADLVQLIQRSTAEASEIADILLPEELNLFLIPALNTNDTSKPDLRFSQQVLTVLSARSPLDFNRPGPYIITLHHPIGEYNRKNQMVDMLYVDLTNVHPGALAEVVRTYKQAVLSKELRGQEKLRSLRLSLLRLAFLAEDSIGFARTAAASIERALD